MNVIVVLLIVTVNKLAAAAAAAVAAAAMATATSSTPLSSRLNLPPSPTFSLPNVEALDCFAHVKPSLCRNRLKGREKAISSPPSLLPLTSIYTRPRRQVNVESKFYYTTPFSRTSFWSREKLRKS